VSLKKREVFKLSIFFFHKLNVSDGRVWTSQPAKKDGGSVRIKEERRIVMPM
jgi:hypothetical protein